MNKKPTPFSIGRWPFHFPFTRPPACRPKVERSEEVILIYLQGYVRSDIPRVLWSRFTNHAKQIVPRYYIIDVSERYFPRDEREQRWLSNLTNFQANIREIRCIESISRASCTKTSTFYALRMTRIFYTVSGESQWRIRSAACSIASRKWNEKCRLPSFLRPYLTASNDILIRGKFARKSMFG